MNEMPRFPEGLLIEVKLRAGVVHRFVQVGLKTGAQADDDPLEPFHTPPDVIRRFLSAVDLGLLAGPSEGQKGEILHARHEADLRQQSAEWDWDLKLPPLHVDAFRLLARMVWTVPGVRTLRIEEKAHEELLSVRTLDSPPGTSRLVPWKVLNHLEEEAKHCVILVVFQEAAPPEIVRATHEVLRGWADVVAYGGFSGGRSAPFSVALLSETGTELASEVFATFQDLVCTADAWDALFRGLLRVHADAPIVRVEMR